MNVLKRYHDSIRELDTAEMRFAHREIDEHQLQHARDEAREAREAWEAIRDELTEHKRVELAQQAAREDVQNGKKDRAPDELMHTKALIKNVRTQLKQARTDNKALYAELATNRETKKALNDEYTRLRARKKELEEMKKYGKRR